MLTYPNIDPAAIRVGDFAIHWYGLMYLIGFVGGWWLGRVRAQRPDSGWNPAEIGDLLFYVALGVVLGGRVGYVLFYNFGLFLEDPLMLFRIWQGGMSFHGGLLGVLFGMWLYGRRTNRRFFEVTDFIAPLIPIGLGAGRIGNFINGELWGVPLIFLGEWCSPLSMINRDIRPCSTRLYLKVWCYLRFCGFTRHDHGRRWRYRAFS